MSITKNAGSNFGVFLRKFLQSPRRIGSAIPSSDFLARAMIQPIDWSRVRSIVELGAGTGVFTRYIQQLKQPDCAGIIFEQDVEMRERLRRLYPGLIYRSNAENLYSDITELGFTQVDCILSGLPFANFSKKTRDCVLEGIARSLKPGGQFVAFQYSLQMRRHLEEQFSSVDLKVVPLNLPPAFVYSCVN